MAFTFDDTTARGKVRLLIGDTDTGDASKQMFTDSNIDAFLSLGDNEVYAATAAACRSLATAAAGSSILMKAEKLLELDRKSVSVHFRLMAADFERKSNAIPTEEIDSVAYGVGHFGNDTSEYVGDPF